MKRLHKLVIKSFAGPFAATFFIVLFILVMQFLWKYVDDLVGKGLEWHIIAELLFYASASLVPLALPLAILLSSMMTFGNLAENYELTAMKSAGVSLLRVMFPLLVLVVGISVGAFFFSNHVIPTANLKFMSLLWDVRQQRPALDIREGVFYGGLDGYTLRIGSKGASAELIEDITIYDHTSGRGNVIVIKADNGEMFTTDDERWLVVRLFNGIRYEEMENRNVAVNTFPHNRTQFGEFEMRFDLSAFTLSRTNQDLFRDHVQMLNIEQLTFFRDSTKVLIVNKQAHINEFIKPYFRHMQDTAFFEKNGSIEVSPLTGASFIDNVPINERSNVLARASNHARTIKGITNVHGNEMRVFERLIIRYQIEYHRKFVLSVASLLLFLIGAPLGAIIRKGGLGMPAVVSILLFIFFHILMISFEKMARQAVILPFWGMWTPLLILFPIGLFLTWKANNDSVIFNKETYLYYFKWIFGKFKKNETAGTV